MRGGQSSQPFCGMRLTTNRGQYDEAYLEYLRALIQSLSEHGLVAYIVSHLQGTRGAES